MVCRAGRWIGWVDDQALRNFPVQHWDLRKIGDYIKPIEDLSSIDYNAPLWQAVKFLESSPEGRLLVFGPAGLPTGTVDRMDVGEALLKRLGIKLPQPILDEARKSNNYPLGLVILPQVVATMSAQPTNDSDLNRARF